MSDWKSILVQKTKTILDVIAIIDRGGVQLALVVDENGRLLGTVTDGDVRRGILKGKGMADSVMEIMNANPITARESESTEEILKKMKDRSLLQIPVLDSDRRVVDLQILERILKGKRHENAVVLMAGGEGKRLYPLTKDTPKPLLKVGDKPILETILQNFVSQGFHNFHLSVNYKAEMIEDYFEDGSKWGCEVSYIREDSQMGTAGALSLLPRDVQGPIIVMNGDVLTKTNFEALLNFHKEEKAEATMCVREYDFQVPYGVVRLDGTRIQAIDEKPVHTFYVNGGIYVLNPSALELIPKNSAFDMPSVFSKLAEQGRKGSAYALREYWLDIGRSDDFERASVDYKRYFQN